MTSALTGLRPLLTGPTGVERTPGEIRTRTPLTVPAPKAGVSPIPPRARGSVSCTCCSAAPGRIPHRSHPWSGRPPHPSGPPPHLRRPFVASFGTVGSHPYTDALVLLRRAVRVASLRMPYVAVAPYARRLLYRCTDALVFRPLAGSARDRVAPMRPVYWQCMRGASARSRLLCPPRTDSPG